jgi:hypothetical protein
MYPLHSINLNILKVKGRSDLFFYLEIIKKINITVILLMSIQFGVMGILIGQIISSVLSYLPNSYYSGKLIDYPAKEQIQDFFPGLLLSSVIAFVIYIAVELSTQPALIELVFFSTLAGIMYIAASYTLKLEALKLAEELVREKLRRKA